MKKVFLVGAGPGDPELITLKAKRLLEQAECILFDHLAPAELLDLAPASAERIYVGKKKSDHTLTQEQICALLVERGLRCLNVVRLKGGDPLLFGRGGEEAEALAAAGIPFEIVPGVTSPLGIAAYTGVPLTHRDHTSVVTFITGHDVAKIDWAKVGAAETLVIFMGLSHFDEIALRIVAAGRSSSTPAMAVRWGTRPDQEVIAGTLATLPTLIHERGMKPPATIVVGEVVGLRDTLSWYEKLPLFGQSIVVTRAREQATAMVAPLRQLGAEAIELPTIAIEPPSDPAPLDNAIANLPSWDWLMFTSVNGVRRFQERLAASAFDTRAIRGRLCAIGPATRDALSAMQLKVDVMAREYVAEGLLEALREFDMNGAKVLIARAAVARDTLPAELTRRGAQVEIAEAYRTIAPAALPARVADVLKRKPDWITFTSTSTAVNFVEAAGGPEALKGIRAASIGPITTAALKNLGIEVSVEAETYTVEGLIAGIVKAQASLQQP
jgi:uroporphyrinogen III methyltransferase/synthase